MEVSYEKTGAFKPETALYLKYQKVMLRKALRYTAQMDDAEDIVSACWLSLLQRLPMLMEMKEATRYAYIMTSVRNRAIDFLRRQKRAGILYGDYQSIELVDPNWKRSFEHMVMRDMIERFLPLLTPRERAVTLRKTVRAARERDLRSPSDDPQCGAAALVSHQKAPAGKGGGNLEVKKHL